MKKQVIKKCALLNCSLMSDSFDSMDYSPPGSSVQGDSPGKNTGVGCHALLQGIFATQGSNLGLPHCRQILYHLSHQGSPKILEWVAYPFSRGPSQLNCGLLHCRQILYQLSYQRSLIKEYLLFNSIYTNCENRQNYTKYFSAIYLCGT